MDPSMLLGFLCQSFQDFDNLCSRIEKVDIKILKLRLKILNIYLLFFFLLGLKFTISVIHYIERVSYLKIMAKEKILE